MASAIESSVRYRFKDKACGWAIEGSLLRRGQGDHRAAPMWTWRRRDSRAVGSPCVRRWDIKPYAFFAFSMTPESVHGRCTCALSERMECEDVQCGIYLDAVFHLVSRLETGRRGGIDPACGLYSCENFSTSL